MSCAIDDPDTWSVETVVITGGYQGRNIQKPD